MGQLITEREGIELAKRAKLIESVLLSFVSVPISPLDLHDE